MVIKHVKINQNKQNKQNNNKQRKSRKENISKQEIFEHLVQCCLNVECLFWHPTNQFKPQPSPPPNICCLNSISYWTQHIIIDRINRNIYIHIECLETKFNWSITQSATFKMRFQNDNNMAFRLFVGMNLINVLVWRQRFWLHTAVSFGGWTFKSQLTTMWLIHDQSMLFWLTFSLLINTVMFFNLLIQWNMV